MAFDLKDESEVKDYIEKLGVEYRFGCYSEKNPEGKTILPCPEGDFHVFSYLFQYVISWATI